MANDPIQQSPTQNAGVPSNGEVSAVWLEHENDVRGFVGAKMSGVPATVIDDVVQEVLIAAANHDRVNGAPDSWLGWMRGVARHKISDHWRRECKYQGEALAVDHFETSEPTPYEWVLRIEREEQLQNAMRSLSPDDRVLLERKYFHAESYEAISKALGKTVKSVEYRLMKAREKLRRHIQSIT